MIEKVEEIEQERIEEIKSKREQNEKYKEERLLIEEDIRMLVMQVEQGNVRKTEQEKEIQILKENIKVR